VAMRARDELGAALGVDPPAAVTLRFHPTVEAYERATGQPWFTAGATAGAEAQILPASVLRRRGLLERTIRHELVHVLTSGTLEGRPRWLLEGVAAYYAEGRRPDPDRQAKSTPEPAPVPCPSDSEFTKPASADALRAAYARARTCVARQLAGGARWNEIR